MVRYSGVSQAYQQHIQSGGDAESFADAPAGETVEQADTSDATHTSAQDRRTDGGGSDDGGGGGGFDPISALTGFADDAAEWEQETRDDRWQTYNAFLGAGLAPSWADLTGSGGSGSSGSSSGPSSGSPGSGAPDETAGMMSGIIDRVAGALGTSKQGAETVVVVGGGLLLAAAAAAAGS